MRHSVSVIAAGITAGLAGLLLVAGATAAAAEPLSPKQAKKQLFRGDRLRVELLDLSALSPTTRAQAEAIATSLTDPEIAAQWAAMGFSMGYYGAMAVKPDRPLSPESMAISNNLHSPEAAEAAAMQACNALGEEEGECVPVALILPRRYKARDFTLSQAATEAFRSSWGRSDAPQYLAYSPSTWAFVIARGPGSDAAALASCNEQTGLGDSADCVIGIAQE